MWCQQALLPCCTVAVPLAVMAAGMFASNWDLRWQAVHLHDVLSVTALLSQVFGKGTDTLPSQQEVLVQVKADCCIVD